VQPVADEVVAQEVPGTGEQGQNKDTEPKK
jgi:hypothetical protein